MFNWPWPESVLNGPADVSPDGTYNFDTRPPHNTAAYAFVAVCLALTTVGALMRVYSRVWVAKKVHLEDYLALFALVPYLTFIWALIKYIQGGGLFVHQWNIRVGNMLDLAVYAFVFSIIDPVYVIPAKAAILLEWKRIFVPLGTRNMFYWVAWFLISLNSVFYFIATFFVIFANQPVAKSWDVLLPGSYVFDRKTIDIVATGINLTVDVSIFLLPQPVIWSLKMIKSRRIGLSIMFSLGLLSVACAAGRLYATSQTEYPWPTIGDSSYTISFLWMWYLAELTSVNLVLSAPSVPRAFAAHTFLGEILAVLRSWTSVLSSKSSTAISNTWPRTIGSAPNGRLHRLADEDGQAIGLAEFKAMQQAQNDGCMDATSTNFSCETAIMRTIEVDQAEETASKISSDPTQQRQHPWMDVV
ncbi:hypothetical protein GQ53DRAFT_825363 [Thozetella sp. PMI_491]|nr:hypothetical protein GQ53DRAFT_825363 [Thozetella sp. PMI_491]